MQKKTKNSDMSYHRDVSICGYRVDTENLDGEPEDLSIKIEDRSPGTIVGWSSGCGLSVNVYETCQCRCHDKAEDMWEKVGYPPPSFANYPLTVT